MKRISCFVDAINASAGDLDMSPSADQIYWCLEPKYQDVQPDYRVPISDLVDRVLVHLPPDGAFVTWVTPTMLDLLRMSKSDAEAKAFMNLGHALSEASVEFHDVDGVQLGMIETSLPFKASLILAPNLREVVEPMIGWPLMAVVPDREFLYFWAARHVDFARRVGSIVAREYSQAPHPISTELFEITDQSIRAIGAFSTKG